MGSRVRHSRRVAAWRGRAALVFTAACAGGMVTVGGPSWASGTGAAVMGSSPTCAVQIQIGATSATAVVLSGCSGGDYWFSSWVTQSGTYQPGAPQQLLDATDHAPWTVSLPTGQPCFYQVDFSQRQVAPGHSGGSTTRVSSYSGQTPACSGGTTTTVTSSTTVAPTTTTATSSVTTVPITPATTTALSLPPRPPTVASGSATTTTTTTTTIRLGAGQGPPAPGSNPVVAPAAASAARSGFGSLAFTGFALLMAVFVALVLVVAGVGMVRASRAARAFPVDPRSSGPGPGA